MKNVVKYFKWFVPMNSMTVFIGIYNYQRSFTFVLGAIVFETFSGVRMVVLH